MVSDILHTVYYMHAVSSAQKADAEYWDNPQMYLIPGNETAKAHFVLYNFKATEPLNTSQLKNLKVAGTLKYKVCQSSRSNIV